jgi:hypothetical protein
LIRKMHQKTKQKNVMQKMLLQNGFDY